MIEIQNLTKHFSTRVGNLVAVDNLSLSVGAGQIFGFLGPNGAGKTTTVRMLTCLLRPTVGTASINGFSIGRDEQEIRARVGLLTETPGLYDTMSAEKNLLLFGRLYGVKNPVRQVHRFLHMMELWERRHDAVGAFSKGMKQKLAIARAALHNPDVLFLDEPTSGLYPDIAKLVRDFILELKSEGRTIFLCTHNLDEAERLCDTIGIFKHRLLASDTPKNLRRKMFGREQVFRLVHIEAEWVQRIYHLPFVSQARAAGNQMYLQVDNPEEQNPAIVRQLVELGAEIQYVTEASHSLEEIYLRIIQEAEATN